MTQDLERILDGGVRQVLADAVAARPYSHCQFVSQAVAAVVTVEDDIRFLPDTLAAVLEQTVLPGVIVVADCSGQTMQSMETTFDVVTTSSEPLEYVPQAQTVSVQIVNTQGARSFGDAVQKAIGLARLTNAVKNLWLLHDDSRPATPDCLSELLEAQRNTPGASILGAKIGRAGTCTTWAHTPTSTASPRWWSTANPTRNSTIPAPTCSASPSPAHCCH